MLEDDPTDQERDPQYDDMPLIPQGLIEALQARLPERWPNVEMPDRDIWVRAGQLRLVEFLAHVQKKQIEESSKENLT